MVDAFELTLVQARGQATVYCPPHALNFDRGPTKKACHSHSTPEVHVAVNFGSQNPGAVASVASVEIEKNLAPRSCTSSPDIESPVVPSSPLEFNPPILLLLQLMDLNDPSKTFKYIEFEQEFRKFGIRGILDVYRLPRMVLATFGTLGWYGANHLHAYIEGRLMSLIKPGEGKVAVSRFPSRPPGQRRVSELGQPLTTGKRPLIEISHRMSTLMTGQPASSRRAQRTGWRVTAELPL